MRLSHAILFLRHSADLHLHLKMIPTDHGSVLIFPLLNLCRFQSQIVDEVLIRLFGRRTLCGVEFLSKSFSNYQVSNTKMADLLAYRGGTASSGGKRPDMIDQREPVVLSYKNIQAMRTLFNISHQLNLVLGPTSWILVCTLASALLV